MQARRLGSEAAPEPDSRWSFTDAFTREHTDAQDSGSEEGTHACK